MNKSDLNRRDFHRLAATAFGGVLAGTAIGCGNAAKDAATPPAGDSAAADADASPAAADGMEEEGHVLLTGANVCRGLNSCKNHKGGDNACAGMGICATAAAHDCHTHNECKGQGGCGSTPGQNACKGKGECAVPLGEAAWKQAREAFEAAMKAAGKEFGEAPAKT